MKKFLSNLQVLKLLTPHTTLTEFEKEWLNGLQRKNAPQELLRMEQQAKLKVQAGHGEKQFLTSTKHKAL